MRVPRRALEVETAPQARVRRQKPEASAVSLPDSEPNNRLQATAYSVRCAAVVHAASPSQMGRMQRISLGQRLTRTRKGKGTRACRQSRERREDAKTAAWRDPRDMAKARLPEVCATSPITRFSSQRREVRKRRPPGHPTHRMAKASWDHSLLGTREMS
jgi:hypothetical protein